MNNKRVAIATIIIGGLIILVVLTAKNIGLIKFQSVRACCNFNPNPSVIPTIKVCDKPYYSENELVAYFRDVKTNEAYYLTNDWCVVKGILWWGGVFAKYNVKTEELKANIDHIFPEPQVYFGLVPISFLGSYYPSKNFTTKTLKDYGYFTVDNPFKNIYGDNLPTPPKFVESKDATLAYVPGSATNAKILLNRMADLQNIFEQYILKGYCLKLNFYPDLKESCNYFRYREEYNKPDFYYSFKKATQTYTSDENY